MSGWFLKASAGSSWTRQRRSSTARTKIMSISTRLPRSRNPVLPIDQHLWYVWLVSKGQCRLELDETEALIYRPHKDNEHFHAVSPISESSASNRPASVVCLAGF